MTVSAAPSRSTPSSCSIHSARRSACTPSPATSPIAATPQLAFSWVERNGPPVVAPTHQGFGSRLISAALPGTPHITFDSRGFEYTVDVPLSDVTRASKDLATPDEAAHAPV